MFIVKGRAAFRGAIIGPGANPISFTLVNSLARTDTTAKVLGQIPANAVIVSVEVWAAALSNAGTTANVSVGKTGTNNFFVNALDVKGGTLNAQNFPVAANLFASIGAAAVNAVGIYAETGAASTAGGPFWVCIEGYVP